MYMRVTQYHILLHNKKIKKIKNILLYNMEHALLFKIPKDKQNHLLKCGLVGNGRPVFRFFCHGLSTHPVEEINRRKWLLAWKKWKKRWYIEIVKVNVKCFCFLIAWTSITIKYLMHALKERSLLENSS